MKLLVSIIIPTFNRASIIGETLNSIINQTYPHWECIVVDDGSVDETDALLQEYCKKDTRFHFYKRPNNYLPGGNGARNYGFLKSQGALIQWFDSDDLMTPLHLETKVNAFEDESVDFVISKSKYLNHDNPYFYPYELTSSDLTFEAFSMTSVSWTIEDFMVKREIALKETFNEQLKSGQEYNFCCKILLHIKNPKFINQFLSLRRIVSNSIGNTRRKDRNLYLQSRFENAWLNYLDISPKANNIKFDKYTLLVSISAYFLSDCKITLPKNFHQSLYKTFKFKAVYFYLAKVSFRMFGSYIFFYTKMKR